MEVLTNIWAWLGNNAAVIIALSALFFTAYQAYASRQHNKLSVRPHLATHGSRDSIEGVGRVRFNLLNNGLGPAIIKKYQFLVKNEPVLFNSSKEANDFLSTVLGDASIKHVISTLPYDYVMSPSEEKLVFDITFTDKDGKTWDDLEDFLDIFSLEVVYQSIYGDEYVFCTMAEIS